jgi:hypothetical protein
VIDSFQLSASQNVEKRYREVLKKQKLSETEIDKLLQTKRERRTSKTLSEISDNSKIRFNPILFGKIIQIKTN